MISCDANGNDKIIDINNVEFNLNKIYNAPKGIIELEKLRKLFIINTLNAGGDMVEEVPTIDNTCLVYGCAVTEFDQPLTLNPDFKIEQPGSK